MRNSWHIEDNTVIEALRQNGFTCEKPPQPEPIPAVVRFITQTPEEVAAGEKSAAKQRWYETDCPIEWNETYPLHDGHILKSEGTSLVLL